MPDDGCRGLVIALEVEGWRDGSGVEGWCERLVSAVAVRAERDGDCHRNFGPENFGPPD